MKREKYGRIIRKNIQKLYWKKYLSIEHEFIQTTEYVTLEADNYTTYSTAFLKLLLEIGREIDITARALCTDLWQENNVINIDDFRKHILRNIPGFEQVCVVCENLRETPWLQWGQGKNPDWWAVYNKVKHERFKLGKIGDLRKEHYKFANQGNVLKALMGLYQIEIYILNLLIKREGKDEVFSYLKTSFFSLDGCGWESSNFHKDGEPFLWGHGMYW